MSLVITQQKGTKMNKKVKVLATAFFENAPCSISYRDKCGGWTERTINIEEMGRSHVLAKCELRGGAYRRFNFGCIRRASPVTPPT